MKIRAGSVVKSTKRGEYTTARTQTVRLYHYINGYSCTASTALNDRDVYYPLLEKGYDFAPLKKLREDDYQAFHTVQMVEIRRPTVVWAGTGGYWCETDINNVVQVMP